MAMETKVSELSSDACTHVLIEIYVQGTRLATLTACYGKSNRPKLETAKEQDQYYWTNREKVYTKIGTPTELLVNAIGSQTAEGSVNFPFGVMETITVMAGSKQSPLPFSERTFIIQLTKSFFQRSRCELAMMLFVPNPMTLSDLAVSQNKTLFYAAFNWKHMFGEGFIGTRASLCSNSTSVSLARPLFQIWCEKMQILDENPALVAAAITSLPDLHSLLFKSGAIFVNTDTVRLLISQGANPCYVCPLTGGTPLHLACFRLDAEFIQLLIHHRADPLRKDKKGWSPLMYLVHRTPEANKIWKIPQGQEFQRRKRFIDIYLKLFEMLIRNKLIFVYSTNIFLRRVLKGEQARPDMLFCQKLCGMVFLSEKTRTSHELMCLTPTITYNKEGTIREHAKFSTNHARYIPKTLIVPFPSRSASHDIDRDIPRPLLAPLLLPTLEPTMIEISSASTNDSLNTDSVPSATLCSAKITAENTCHYENCQGVLPTMSDGILLECIKTEDQAPTKFIKVMQVSIPLPRAIPYNLTVENLAPDDYDTVSISSDDIENTISPESQASPSESQVSPSEAKRMKRKLLAYERTHRVEIIREFSD